MATTAGSIEARNPWSRQRFVAAIFVGSFLLFLVQPMVARMALPRLGGAPSVWNSAMLVYQALLLGGYAYAHWTGRFAPRRQAVIHIALLLAAGLMLPIGLIAAVPPPSANPFLWVPWLLLVSIGPLFFAVSAQAPLLQRWYSEIGTDPYPLYAASNLGSFGGLIAYPLLVEPLLPIGEQRLLWSLAYGLMILLVGWCAMVLPRNATQRPPEEATPNPSRREFGFWILLAAVPSGLILSTTLHITTDLVAMPLLWVLPLGVYLLSFTFAFATNRKPAEAIARLAPLFLLLACFAVFVDQNWLALVFCVISIVNLFTVSVSLHSRLFDSRPDAQHLTLFYLAMSIGGVIGGAFCALLAPLIFDWTYEHLILLAAAAALMINRNPFEPLGRLWNDRRRGSTLTMAAIVLLILLAFLGKDVLGFQTSKPLNHMAMVSILVIAIAAIGNRLLFTAAVCSLLIAAGGWERLELSAAPGKMTRSFFGIYSIRPAPNDARMLVHGTTLHGVQNIGSSQRERMETTYYAHGSGVGLAMDAVPQLFGASARVGVVGLGAGTLACYAQPGQRWTFFEIDPVVATIARDPQRFSFISQCKPDARIEIGDARLLIERKPPAVVDLLVIDAFSSDSVPMHLLTEEAFADYRRMLSGRGLLMVHISNRYLDLQPVVAAAAMRGGWHAIQRQYVPDSTGSLQNESASNWIAMSPSADTLKQLIARSPGKWTMLQGRKGFTPWTDDHASVMPLIKL